MTPADLRRELEKRNIHTKFFCKENMKFAGDTMSNFGVRSVSIKLEPHYNLGDREVECWELYRKRRTAKGFSSSFYFTKTEFRKVSPA